MNAPNDEEKEIELSAGKKLAGNLIAGGYTVLCGLFLLLVGLKVFGTYVTVANMALPTILFTVGLVFLTTAILQTNTVSLWLSFVFIVPAAVTYLNNFTAATYASLYPLYIAIPAIASLFTLPMSRGLKDHLPVILFFGLLAGIFALQSSSTAGWAVVLPIVVVYIGAVIVITAIRINKGGKDK